MRLRGEAEERDHRRVVTEERCSGHVVLKVGSEDTHGSLGMLLRVHQQKEEPFIFTLIPSNRTTN